MLEQMIAFIKRRQEEKRALLEKEIINALELDTEFISTLRSEYRRHRNLATFDKIMFFKLYEVSTVRDDDHLLDKVSVPKITWHFFDKLRDEEDRENERLRAMMASGKRIRPSTDYTRDVKKTSDEDDTSSKPKPSSWWGKL